MGSIHSPRSLIDIDNIFEDFINLDCLFSEVPSTLNSSEATLRDNLVQQQQSHLRRLPPLTIPERHCTSSSNWQLLQVPALDFSELHFLATEITDLPCWADPFDLFNFDLITPPAMLSIPLLAAPDHSIPQVAAKSVQPVPPNPMRVTLTHSPSQYYILPQTTPSLHSTTASPSSIAPPPAPPFTLHTTITATPATTTSPFTPAKLSPNPPLKKPSARTSLHCSSSEITQNLETTHHHHHKDSKRRFCCSYAGCTSCTSYTTRKDRKRHEVSKHGVLHLVCDVCGHTTARTDNMRVHVRAAHKEECEVVMKRIVGARVGVVMGSR
ncbi:hypothetical protein B9Z19DRAFT_1062380 [Tuber borchii]|uniref:C2H2-type domain-containing protein n=1 Tax=Tuber borchii TaxID=42251 RepID=A0A2T7A268_TUBBO|nr:hypothetical protein B9Z19DRAFT_1062380 [Tuber borchii]